MSLHFEVELFTAQFLPLVADERCAAGIRHLVYHEDEGFHGKGQHRLGRVGEGGAEEHSDALCDR